MQNFDSKACHFNVKY